MSCLVSLPGVKGMDFRVLSSSFCTLNKWGHSINTFPSTASAFSESLAVLCKWSVVARVF